MKALGILTLTLLFCLFPAAAVPQRNMSPPPPPMDPDKAQNQPQDVVRRRVDLAQLQRDADLLARTAQTIPSDVANVRKGTLPKDVIAKLKQIEKLSKHLRSELNP